jgi:hypothetical protein
MERVTERLLTIQKEMKANQGKGGFRNGLPRRGNEGLPRSDDGLSRQDIGTSIVACQEQMRAEIKDGLDWFGSHG